MPDSPTPSPASSPQPSTPPGHDATSVGRLARFLNWVERAGNKLPDPMTLFIVGALFVLVLSQVAAVFEWEVEKTIATKVTEGTGEEATTRVVEKKVTVKAEGLLSGDGAYWAISNMVKNFTGFAPLGVVLVGMLGIGVAEKTGAIGAGMKVFMILTPAKLLTPAMVFVGVMSSMALDAGYVVLPPLAAALYKSVGRSPMAGLAAVFSGVAAGFSANLFITGLDPYLSELTQIGAQVVSPDRLVAPSCNWWFMIASTILLTLIGWAVTAWYVEPRFAGRGAEEGGPSPLNAEDESARQITAEETRGLVAGIATFAVAMLLIIVMVRWPGAPLHGTDAPSPFARWVLSIVPLLFMLFLLPGIAFGIAAKTIKSDKDVAKLMAASMADMAPYIVLAFFAAQFVAYFNHSHLGEMLAITGGQALASANIPVWLLLILFIIVVMIANLFIGSAGAKWAFLGPVFVPMFMSGAKISPELTQAAYRVGDSISNTITPLNPYVIIILVFMQKYVPKAGLGSLVALMLPYTIAFFIVWTLLLVVWVALGVPLGPNGPLFVQ